MSKAGRWWRDYEAECAEWDRAHRANWDAVKPPRPHPMDGDGITIRLRYWEPRRIVALIRIDDDEPRAGPAGNVVDYGPGVTDETFKLDGKP